MKKTPVEMLFSGFDKSFYNSLFREHPRTAASEYRQK